MVSLLWADTGEGTSGNVTLDTVDPSVTVITPTTNFSIPEYEDLTVTWEATDNIGADSIRIYYSNDGGSNFTYQGIQSGDSTQFTFIIPEGLTDEAQVKLVAVDTYGNEGEGYSDFFSVVTNYNGPVWYVSTSGSDIYGYGTEESPFATIQHGIDVASDGDTVLVLPGNYVENLSFPSHSIVLRSISGPDLTVINANFTGHAIEIVTQQSDPITSFEISGFTIKNGQLTTDDPYGGGIKISVWNSHVIVQNNIIRDNTTIPSVGTQADGGGIYVSSSNSFVEIINNVFENNSATPNGGAISIGYSGYLDQTQGEIPLIKNNLIINNTATSTAGAIFAPLPGVDVSCVFNTFYNNTSDDGTSIEIRSGTYIKNCIIVVGTLSNHFNTDSSATYSIIDGGWIGMGNIDDDPLFIDPENDDYHLQWGSPAIDTGDPISPLDPDSTRADMGAYYFNQSDSIPPVVSITNLSATNIGTDDELTVNWEASDNWILDSAFVDIFYSDEEVIRVDTTMAEIGQATIDVPDTTLTPFQLIVTIWDYNHNEAKDTSEVITVFDNTPPAVSVASPSSEFYIPEYNDLTVTWSASDNIGTDSVRVYFSNDGGTTFNLMGEETADSTHFIFNIPGGLTDEAQVKLVAVDIYGNEGEGYSEYFSVTDNTPPTIQITSPESGASLAIGSSANVTWTENDNVGIVQRYYQHSSGLGWTDMEPDSVFSDSLWFTVPNTPTDNFGMRVIAEDAVGLRDTATVTGINVVIEYPRFMTALPADSSLLFLRTSEMQIEFSVAMDSGGFDNIELSSSVSGAVAFTAQLETATLVRLSLSQQLASRDTLTLTLPASSIISSFGYSLDGNENGIADGSPTDDVILTYHTETLADYDHNDVIDLDDLSSFTIAWYAKDYDYELGPFTGEVPHLIPNFDGAFNVQDLVAFVYMWVWNMTSPSGKLLFREWVESGQLVEIETTPDSISITIPDGSLTYELQIQYLPGDIMISDPLEDVEIQLSHNDEEIGIYTLMSAPKDNRKVTLPITVSRKAARISFSFRAVDYEGETLSQLTRELNITGIPKEFALHQNYPNPFNPITTIEYDLPGESSVSLIVFDLLGRQVKQLVSGRVVSGYHQVIWNSTDDHGQPLGSGMYFYRIQAHPEDSGQAGEFSQVRKMILLK